MQERDLGAHSNLASSLTSVLCVGGCTPVQLVNGQVLVDLKRQDWVVGAVVVINGQDLIKEDEVTQLAHGRPQHNNILCYSAGQRLCTLYESFSIYTECIVVPV